MASNLAHQVKTENYNNMCAWDLAVRLADKVPADAARKILAISVSNLQDASPAL